MTSGSHIVSVLASDGHADAIAAFYREVWDPHATAASVVEASGRAAERNVAAPGEAPPVALVLDGSRVVGYCGSIPQRLWDGVEERPAYWVKGLMVLPEYRNGPIGFLVVKELVRHLACSSILTVAPAARRLFAALGYSDLGAVRNWVRLLRAGAMVRQMDLDALGLRGMPRWMAGGVRIAQRTGLAGFVGAGAGVLLDAVAAASRRSSGRFAAAESDVPPSREELDELWHAARPLIAGSPVRDGLYLQRRYREVTPQAGNPYIFATVREGGRLAGVAVVRRPRPTPDPRLGGIHVATLSDIVFPPRRADVGLATLGAIERAARDASADALLCTTSHPAVGLLLRRQTYLRLPGNVHFFLRDTTGKGRWPGSLESWWLARGDGESDEVF